MKTMGFKRPPKKIIIRMPNWIGDLVMATPVLHDVRRRFPGSEITAMCQANVAPLLQHDSDVDELYVFTRPSGWEKKDEQRSIIGKLRAGRYDLGILLTNSLSSAAWFRLGGVKYRLGYRGDWRRALLTSAVPRPEDIEERHLVSVYKRLLEPLGIKESDTKPRLQLIPQEVMDAKALFRRQGIPEGAKVVGINPSAAFGAAKCWPAERFREIAERLDVYVVVFGDASGAATAKQICSGLPERVINLAGATSLRELIACIRLCDVLLTNDSGPMHIAAAVDTPVVALFGSTSSVRTGPYGTGIIIHKHAPCSPCYLRECPIDFRCMKEISVDEVYSEVSKFL